MNEPAGTASAGQAMVRKSSLRSSAPSARSAPATTTGVVGQTDLFDWPVLDVSIRGQRKSAAQPEGKEQDDEDADAIHISEAAQLSIHCAWWRIQTS